MITAFDIKKQVRAEEEEFIASVEWLNIKLKIASFSKNTLYFLRQLSYHIDLDGRDEPLAGVDQEVIVSLVKEQIAEEKNAEADRQHDRSVMILEADDAEEASLSDEPRQVEAVPVELELFSLQEREGIKAIAAYQGVLYGALPTVAAFRQRYLPGELLSAAEVDEFLRSVAVRFLSASDFEQLEVGALSHQAEIVSLTTAKLTTEQKDQLTDNIIVYPFVQRPFTAEEGAGRWYKYTAVIALKSLETGEIKGTSGTKPGMQNIEKTLVVRENKPFSMFSDPFFPQDPAAVIQDSSFPHYFPTSIADDLHQIITSRRASGAIPGDAWKKALFVLTGTISYNPVTIRTATQLTADLNSLEGAALIARRMERGEGLCDRIEIEADAWIKSDTIRRIYHAQQSRLGQMAGGKTRYKISGADSLQLVTEVIRLYLAERREPSYHHAYQVLRQAGKITGTADNFRKRYKRACEILSIPFHLATVVDYLRRHL